MSISLSHISKKFGEKAVFKDFSHDFPINRITCIMGPSGCGKTTLLTLLLGLAAPDEGLISGMEGLSKSAIFQENRLCENVSAAANLRLVNPGLSRNQAYEALTYLGLGDSLRQPVKEFSGGMKRRTAILRALVAQYDILLADEPFKGLDDDTKHRVMTLFKEKTQGKTVILVTHDMSEADFLDSELLLLPPLVHDK